jgi:hypothetical protein
LTKFSKALEVLFGIFFSADNSGFEFFLDADGDFGKDGTGPLFDFMPKRLRANCQIVMGATTHPFILPATHPPANIPVPKNPLRL